jgi:hypothetical protein
MKPTLPVLLAALVGCGGDDDGPAVTLDRPAHCNPLSDLTCAFPFPSSVFLVEDAASATGVRVDIPMGALPTNADGRALDPALFNKFDGFSPNAHIVAAFPGGVDVAGLPRHDDPGASLEADSATVLLDMESGERVVHFAEIDVNDDAVTDPSQRALLIRPLVRLRGGGRYAVAIRRPLRSAAGEELQRPAGFQALLDGHEDAHPLLGRLSGRMPEVLAAMADAGVAEDDLLLAWDFVTSSDEQIRADMTAARDAVLAAMDEGGYGAVTVTYNGLPEGWDPTVIKRAVAGTFTMPLLLTDDGDNGELYRDQDGLPAVNGTYVAPFTAIIPACVDSAPKPIPILLYGHGNFGSAEGELTTGWMRKTSQLLCMVVIGTDWRGGSSQDIASAILTLSDMNRLPVFMDKLVQGINAFIALARVARTTMAGEPAFQEGGALLDPSRVFYYGNSQGGIFGGTFMAYDPVVQRAVLGVGAANYSLYLERSSSWVFYQLVLKQSYTDALERQLLVHLLQWYWDRSSDPVSGLPGLAERKQLLLQAGLGDATVNNLGTDFEARTLGIPVLAPTMYEPYGIPVMSGPMASALNYFKGEAEGGLTTNRPPPENEMHELVRRLGAAVEQMKIFYETGEIVQTCTDGEIPTPCDCTQGHCGERL